MEPDKEFAAKVNFSKYLSQNRNYIFFLCVGFLSLSIWYQFFDYYHLHFFDDHLPVVLYNLSRTVFVGYFIWLIYAAGWVLMNLTVSFSKRTPCTLMENIIICFGAGLGVWHVLMLVLGYYNLYYRNLLLAVCLFLLFCSAGQLRQLVSQTRVTWKDWSIKSDGNFPRITAAIILLGLIWLLMVRGLYPGGGGDYFTHYYYYNLSVIRNHGLMPNDVWYHYYYSKGTGLQFLGMLFMDPEAPAVITFCYVVIAALAIANLVERVAARSLWPAFCVIMYILYNLISEVM